MRQVIILSVLLTASLVGSYVTWNAPDKAADEDQTVDVYAAKDLTAINWTSARANVTVEKKEDDKGPYTWITVEQTREVRTPPPPPAEGEEPGEPEVSEVTETFSFHGNAAADTLWESFSPLTGLRELEGATDFDFEGEQSAKIAITTPSGPVSLEVAHEIAYGSKDRYVRNGQRTFLVDDATLRPLQYGKTRLIERSLFPQTLEAVTRVDVTRDGNTVSFLQSNAADPANAFWSREGSEEEDEIASTWIPKLFKVKVQDYVQPEDADALTLAFSFTVHGDDAQWTIEMLEDPNGRTRYRARSSFNRAIVGLTESLAADAVADVESVLGE